MNERFGTTVFSPRWSFGLLLILLAWNGIFAWGETGHRGIAALAETMLTETARGEVKRLLGAGDDLISVATWADEIRGGRPETGPWHYVILQVRGPQIEIHHADSPNVVTELSRQIQALQAMGNDKSRAEALRWVVHLMADLHQPLHCGEDHDRGGNDTKVRLGRRKVGFHQAWDYALLEKSGLDDGTLVGRLVDSVTSRERLHVGYLNDLASGTVAAYAKESHALAIKAYARGGRPILGRGRVVELSAEDVSWSQKIILDQWLKAGVRLAATLNRALDSKSQGGGLKLPRVRTKPAPSFESPKAETLSSRSGRYGWSEKSQVYHLRECKDLTRISPENLQWGKTPPAGKHLHRNCAKVEAD